MRWQAEGEAKYATAIRYGYARVRVARRRRRQAAQYSQRAATMLNKASAQVSPHVIQDVTTPSAVCRLRRHTTAIETSDPRSQPVDP
jgi:membrane-bound lytic murein transglycosylase MltF